MKELNKTDQVNFEEAVKVCGQILVAAMKCLDIPNFIEASFEMGEDEYKLRFDKVKKESNHSHEQPKPSK